MEYPFIAITPRFTLDQNGSPWSGPIYASKNCLTLQMSANKLCKIELFEMEQFDNLTEFK